MVQILTTPLSLTLDHWTEVRDYASNQSVKVKKKKNGKYFAPLNGPLLVWAGLGMELFNLATILQIKDKVSTKGPHSHPDQVPYIVTWEALVRDPSPWVIPFVPPRPPSLTSPTAPLPSFSALP